MKDIESQRYPREAVEMNVVQKGDYQDWSHAKLIERVTQLEQELKRQNLRRVLFTAPPEQKSWKKPRAEREFDPSKYSTRFIALKLAYLGKRYNGFEHHANNKTPLPTIEEELWKALDKARLILPQGVNPLEPREVNWEGCEYSKCGRTDKGVSAFGQVIGIRVRSNRPLRSPKDKTAVSVNGDIISKDHQNTYPRENGLGIASPALAPSGGKGPEPVLLALEDEAEDEVEDALQFDPVADEIQYASTLNRLLPPDIRILAWCPAPPPDFSARFSCRERQYRYFFTQPAFVPTPGNVEDSSPRQTANGMKDGWLNIEAMQEAAQHFVGLHDFRNFCKVDPSKQISNFERRIFYADIVKVEDTTSVPSFVDGKEFLPPRGLGINGSGANPCPRVYSFNLHGSAFLWHQVRHMVAMLFLVGQGLEPPSIVSELLDVQSNPRKPMYEMASDTPLVLWDCVFPHEEDEERKEMLQWQYVGDQSGTGEAKYGTPGLMEDLWKVWRERKMDEILAGSLIDAVAKQGNDVGNPSVGPCRKGAKSQKVFDGGDKALLRGTYVPVMKKPRLESVETINNRYAVRKGFNSAEELKELGFRRLNKPADHNDVVE
ncbi:MAG: hypothetical protein M1818_000710 [Claussenomyces sp. TS43310]|nr:MAG: hypothetical protein M1818_000710 [Claussenomyces sp. TS43310]